MAIGHLFQSIGQLANCIVLYIFSVIPKSLFTSTVAKYCSFFHRHPGVLSDI